MTRERIMAGLARAKANRVQLGRPKVAAEIEERVRAQLAQGTGILKTARLLHVGTGTVQRIKRKRPALVKVEFIKDKRHEAEGPAAVLEPSF